MTSSTQEKPAAKKRQARKSTTAAKKRTPAQPKAHDPIHIDQPAEAQLLEQAKRYGLDVEKERYDEQAVKGAVDQITNALKKAGVKGAELAMMTLTAEQGERAMAHPAGLTGKALRIYIAEGKDSKAQMEEARAARNEVKTQERREAAAARGQTGPREGSGMWAALQVLKNARKPLTPDEIWAKIKEKKLAPGMKGKTPAATIGAQLATALKAKKIDGLERPEPGKYALKGGGAR